MAGGVSRPSRAATGRGLLPALVLALTAAAPAWAADTFDLHHFWDQRCEECHGHAGRFAHTFLSVEGDRLVGRHHRDDLMRFLGNHGVPAARVKPIYDMLLAQARTAGQFATTCGGCHDSAAGLVRDSLEMRDGVLHGRETGRPVAEFMKRHARLKPDEVPFFVDLLVRIEGEVRSPY